MKALRRPLQYTLCLNPLPHTTPQSAIFRQNKKKAGSTRPRRLSVCLNNQVKAALTMARRHRTRHGHSLARDCLLVCVSGFVRRCIAPVHTSLRPAGQVAATLVVPSAPTSRCAYLPSCGFGCLLASLSWALYSLRQLRPGELGLEPLASLGNSNQSQIEDCCALVLPNHTIHSSSNERDDVLSI